MAPPEPPSSISIRVKVPPGHIDGNADEFSLGNGIPTSTTIGQIRQRIQNILPSRPTPDRQRLLYGGRALVDDEQHLAEAFTIRRDPTQTEYVLHLVVRGGDTSAPNFQAANTPRINHSPNVAPPPVGQPGLPFVPAHPAAGAVPQPGANPMQPPFMPHININRTPNFTEFVQHGVFPMRGLQGADAQNHQTPTAAPAPGVAQTPAGIDGNPSPPPGHGAVNGQPPTTPHPAPQMPPQRPLSSQGYRVEGVGPNGQRFAIHHQTFVSQHGRFQPNMPFSMPHLQQMQMQQTHLQQLAAQNAHRLARSTPPPADTANPGPGNGRPSALEQARANIAEMRRMLEELRSADSITLEQQQQIRTLEERARSLNQYIDPFQLGAGQPPPPQSVSPAPNASPTPQSLSQNHTPPPERMPPHEETTCYLLSSPLGPQAIVYSPMHGMFAGSLNPHAPLPSSALPSMPSMNMPSFSTAFPTPTPTTGTAHPAPPIGLPDPPVHAPATQNAERPGGNNPPVAGQPPQQQQQQDLQEANALGPLQPMLGHMWVLFRVLIFAYFLLGANMGWRRPLILFAIGFAFYLVRLGLFGDGGAIRRWWEGIMLGPQQAAAAAPANPGPVGAAHNPLPPALGAIPPQPQQQHPNPAPAAAAAAAQRMPTPEQLAARLLRDYNAPPNLPAGAGAPAQNPQLAWLRESVRPVERAAALFIASLWPGLGEAAVRAREDEDRRRAEREIEERRVREEAEQAELERREKENEREKERDAVESGEGDGEMVEKSEGVMEGKGKEIDRGDAAVETQASASVSASAAPPLE